jgi:hypothetical protein
MAAAVLPRLIVKGSSAHLKFGCTAELYLDEKLQRLNSSASGADEISV